MPFSFSTMFSIVIAAAGIFVAFTFFVIFRLIQRKHYIRDAIITAVCFYILLIMMRYVGHDLNIRFLDQSFYMIGMFMFMMFLSTLFIFIMDWVLALDSKIQLVAIAILTVVMFSVGIYDAQTYDVKTVTITSGKLDQEYNIVFISDIHLGSEPAEWLDKVVHEIDVINPDMLLIGGDLVDSREITGDDLKSLKALEIPMFMVYGNHDSMIGSSPELVRPVEIIDDEMIDFDGLEIIGLNYRHHGNNSIGDAIDSLNTDSSRFRLLLIHAPIQVDEAAERGIDLMLAGHTHGGQVFPYHLVHKADFGYLYGLYNVSGMDLYVTSGAGVWGPDFRFGSRNEIVRLVLKPG
ncbi:metallophosphoesterase [Candidatus Woesearchaeota archaeon]|nr:metallophosphoesterase [Candidatus Woesearchaeota archaeon]